MTEATVAPFPAQLLNWAGNRSGGVRRLFDAGSGRPGQTVFETNLLQRLEAWAGSLVSDAGGVPRIVLLVGGPGNGKTEAIESTVGWLDLALGAQGKLASELRQSFFPPDGTAVPRLVRVDAAGLGTTSRVLGLSIVQDASAVVGAAGKQAAQLLLEELDAVQAAGPSEAYLCCVNRGVLDDALIEAIDHGREGSRRLLEAVTRAVSLTPDAPSCWPLAGFPEVAVWPMDAESLLVPPTAGGEEPARSLLRAALDEQKWPAPGSCPGGTSCPFCGSRERLSREREEASLLQILRWFEVASGNAGASAIVLLGVVSPGRPPCVTLESPGWNLANGQEGLSTSRNSAPWAIIQGAIDGHFPANRSTIPACDLPSLGAWRRSRTPARDPRTRLDDDNTAMGLQVVPVFASNCLPTGDDQRRARRGGRAA